MSWWHPVCGSGAISRYFMVMPQRNTFILLFRNRAYRSPSLAARNCSAMIQANVGPTYQVIKSEYIMSLFADVVVLNDYGEGEERPYQTSRNRFFCKAPCISVNVTWKNSPLLSWSGNSPPPFCSLESVPVAAKRFHLACGRLTESYSNSLEKSQRVCHSMFLLAATFW